MRAGRAEAVGRLRNRPADRPRPTGHDKTTSLPAREAKVKMPRKPNQIKAVVGAALALVLALGLLAAGSDWGGPSGQSLASLGDDQPIASPTDDNEQDESTTIPAADPPTTVNASDTSNPIAGSTSTRPAPLDLAEAAAQVQRTSALTPLTAEPNDAEETIAPVGFSFPRLGVETATVRPVGVEPNGELEVPPESEVGWYRYSPTPGQAGSSVLAGHVNYDGRDGAFRYLSEVEVGDNFSISYADGTSREFVAAEVSQFDKTELPNERIFARSGPAEVALITCGGTFDYDARSYEDNVVVFAIPA